MGVMPSYAVGCRWGWALPSRHDAPPPPPVEKSDATLRDAYTAPPGDVPYDLFLAAQNRIADTEAAAEREAGQHAPKRSRDGAEFSDAAREASKCEPPRENTSQASATQQSPQTPAQQPPIPTRVEYRTAIGGILDLLS